MSRPVEQHVRRVEGLQLGGLLGPAERRERPQRAREPGVEHVGVLLPALPRRRVDAHVGLLVSVPDRQPMPPPQLARDTPRPDVLHPLQIAPLLPLGKDPDAIRADGLDRGSGQQLHVHEPLQRDQRLDALARAVRERDVVHVGLGARYQSLLAQLGHDGLAAGEHGHARKALAGGVGHATVLADHRDLLETVVAPDLEVVGIVAGSDLQRAGAEVGLHVGVRDDLQPASHERQDHGLADHAGVALVVGIHRDRRVGQHRLRAHRRDRDRPVAGLQWIVDVVEDVLDLALLDLQVRDRRV